MFVRCIPHFACLLMLVSTASASGCNDSTTQNPPADAGTVDPHDGGGADATIPDASEDAGQMRETLRHLGPPDTSVDDLFAARDYPCLFDNCQTNCRIDTVTRMPVGEFTDVVDDGTYIYAASDFGLEIFEHVDGRLARVGQHALPGESTAVDVSGSRAVVRDEAPDATHVFDTSDVSQPRWLGTLEPDSTPRPNFTGLRPDFLDIRFRPDIEMTDSLVARVGFSDTEALSYEIHHVDLFELDQTGSPVARSRVRPEADHFIVNIFIDADVLMMLSTPASSRPPRQLYVTTFEVSDPSDPVVLTEPTAIPGATFRAWSVAGYDYDRDILVYNDSRAAYDGYGVFVIDLSNPALPQRAGFIPVDRLSGSLGSDVAVSYPFAAVQTTEGMDLIDISDPLDPKLARTLEGGQWSNRLNLARTTENGTERIFSFPRQFYREAELDEGGLYRITDLTDGVEGAEQQRVMPPLGPTAARAEHLLSVSFTGADQTDTIALRGARGTTLVENPTAPSPRAAYLEPFDWWSDRGRPVFASFTSPHVVLDDYVLSTSKNSLDLGVRERTPAAPVGGEPSGDLRVEYGERVRPGIAATLLVKERRLFAVGRTGVSRLDTTDLGQATFWTEAQPAPGVTTEPLAAEPMPGVDNLPPSPVVRVAYDGRWAYVLNGKRRIERLDLTADEIRLDTVLRDAYLTREGIYDARTDIAADDDKLVFMNERQGLATFELDERGPVLRGVKNGFRDVFAGYFTRLLGVGITGDVVVAVTPHHLHVLDFYTLEERARVRLADWIGMGLPNNNLIADSTFDPGTSVVAEGGRVHIATRSHYAVYDVSDCMSGE